MVLPAESSKRKRQQAELEEELHRCARAGDFDRLRELVEIDRVSIECSDAYNGSTPLILAVIWEHTHIARYLIGKGANVHAKDKDGDCAFRCAMYDDRVEVAQLLLQNDADVEARCFVVQDTKYYSPLGLAIYRCSANMVALLLRFGANTAETLYEDETNTAVYFACCHSTAGIVKLLLDHNDGVDANTITPSSGNAPAMSPLCHVCRQGNLEMARLLIQNGARIIYDGVNPDSPSPLVHAIAQGSLELIQFLLDSSRFSLSANNDNPHPLPEIGRGNHPLSKPLEAAIEKNKLNVAQLLVDHGANVNDRPFLWKCARDGYAARALFLLRNGANVNLTDSDSGETPLWAAAKNGNADLVKEFIKAQADVNICDNGGEMPLEVARRNGHKRCVYLLLRTSPHVWSRLGNAL